MSRVRPPSRAPYLLVTARIAGHHLRGTTIPRKLLLVPRGLCEGLLEGSAGFYGGSTGFSKVFRNGEWPHNLVAQTWRDPNRATQCCAHNVAADSRSFRDPYGPNDWKNSRSPSRIQIFKRDCELQGSRPPNPYFHQKFWSSRFGTKKTWQPETWQDSTLCFSARKSGNFLQNLEKTETLHRKPGENKKKNRLEKAQRIQWRKFPEIADFCPLSWSKVSRKIEARLTFSIEIENFKRDWNFSIFGPLRMSQECRATLPPRTVSHLFPHPSQLCAECSGQRRTDVRLEGEASHWKCQRCRGKVSFRKRIALHGGVAAAITPIVLHYATKHYNYDRGKAV